MTPNKVFVVEIEPVVDAAGTTETHLFCSAPWATSPTDVPANTPVRPYLQNAGTFKQELFSGARVTGAIRPSFGNVTLANPAPTIGDEGPFDAWLGYGLSGAKVTVRWGVIGDAYPSQWEVVYIAYAASAIVDTSSVTLRLRDRLYLLDAPVVTDGFDGSGGLEGSGSVPKLKQFVAGSAGFIPPILVDPIKQIYFVQSTSDGGLRDFWVSNLNEVSLWDVFENGVEITRATTDYESGADLLANAPIPGEVKYWWGADSTWVSGWKTGPIYFRLGTPPVGELRVYADGYPTDDDHARWGAGSGSFSFAHMAMRAGIDRDSIEYSRLSITQAMIDDDTTFLDVMASVCLHYQGFFGMTRLDKFRASYLCDPRDDDRYYGVDWEAVGMASAPTPRPTTSVFTVTPENGKELRREPVNGIEAPVWKLTVKAGKTWACQVAEGASNKLRDYLSRDPWLATFQGYSDTALLANPGAIAATVEIPWTSFPNVFSRKVFLGRYFALFGGRRDLFTVTVPLETATFAINLHDVVTLEWPRLGLGGGVKCRVVSIFIDCSAGVPSMRLGLWAGEIGEFTGTVSMVPPGGGSAGPVPSYIQIGRQRLAPVELSAYGTVSGVGGGGFAGYARQILANITQISYGDAVIPPEWDEEGALTGSGADVNQYLGVSHTYGAGAVALDETGAYCAVGCSRDGSAAAGAGAAYIFVRSGSTWSEQQMLTASDATAYDRFGNSVALNSAGDTVAVGSPYDANGIGSYAGSVYIFTRSGSSWTEQDRVEAATGGGYEYLGTSVALNGDGNTLAAGAVGDSSNAGAVHVFTRSGGTWSHQQELTASDAAASQSFGWHVSLSEDGDTLAIGARDDDNTNGTNAGAVYIFTRSGGVWTEQQKIIQSTTGRVGFGASCSLSSDGDTLIIASPDIGGSNQEASIWTRSGGTYSEHTVISGSGSSTAFGTSVAMGGGDVCAISDHYWNTPNTNCGRVRVYRLSGGSWALDDDLQSSVAAASDLYGFVTSISRDGTRVAAAAIYDDTAASNAGAVYVHAYS